MPLKRRLLICAVFLVSFFALACSIIRLPYIIGTLENNTPYTDLYVFEPGNVWSLAELHVALVCACLPTIHPIITRWRKASTSASSGQPTRYPLGPSGYRLTGSTSKGVDFDSEPLTKYEHTIQASARHTDEVELGQFDFVTPQAPTRAAG